MDFSQAYLIGFKKITGFLFILFLAVIQLTHAEASEAPVTATIVRTAKSWSYFKPFIPEKNEYKFEVGGMWEEANLYWLGATYGRHLRRCYFSKSEKCQQYLDFTGGVGGERTHTQGIILVGPRWQYVSFPKPYSPSFGLFTGVMNIRDNERDKKFALAGVSFGLSATLHEKLDIKWENRLGYADQAWAQSVFSISLKLDKWVDSFTDKMKQLGDETLDATGSIIKGTIEAPKTLFDWFNNNKKNK